MCPLLGPPHPCLGCWGSFSMLPSFLLEPGAGLMFLCPFLQGNGTHAAHISWERRFRMQWANEVGLEVQAAVPPRRHPAPSPRISPPGGGGRAGIIGSCSGTCSVHILRKVVEEAQSPFLLHSLYSHREGSAGIPKEN